MAIDRRQLQRLQSKPKKSKLNYSKISTKFFTVVLSPEALFRSMPMGIGLVSIFAGQILLARGLGSELLGEYSLILAWINFSVIFAVAGFQFSATKVLPALWSGDAIDAVRFAVRYLLSRVAFLSLIAAGILSAVVAMNPYNVAPNGFFYLSPVLLLVPILAFSQVRTAIASALGCFWVGQTPDNIVRPLLVGTIVFYLGWINYPLDIQTVILLSLFTYGFTALLGGLLLWYAVPVPKNELYDAQGVRAELRGVAIFMGASSIVISFMKSVDIIIVGANIPPRELAVYVVVTRLAEIVNVIYFLIDPVFLPRISTLIRDSDRKPLLETVRTYCWCSSVWSLGCFLLSLGLGGFLLSLYGQQYVSAWPILLIMLFGLSINAFTGPGGQLLMIGGFERLNFYTTLISACWYIVSIYVLTSMYGTYGAVISLVLYQIFRGLLQAFFVRLYLGFGITIFDGEMTSR